VSGPAADPATPVAGLDAGAVGAWLEGLGIGARPPIALATIGQGKSNITALATDADGRRWVLRRPPLGELLPSAHDVAREHRVLAALQPTPVPTPGVVAFTTDPAVTDAPLLAMEHVDGLVVDAPAVAERLPLALRGAIGDALPRTLAAVHAVDLEASGLLDLASHRPYAARQLKRWTRQWEDSKTRELPRVDALAQRLRDAIPAQRELTLVHGDFHLVNAIVDAGDGDVRALLDWELCTLGDPLADLGGLLAYWAQPGDPPGAPFPASALPGFPTRRQLAQRYAEETGRDLSALGFWHALGLWKVAIICEGVLRRALDDPRNAERGATFPRAAIDGLIERAWQVAGAAGL